MNVKLTYKNLKVIIFLLCKDIVGGEKSLFCSSPFHPSALAILHTFVRIVNFHLVMYEKVTYKVFYRFGLIIFTSSLYTIHFTPYKLIKQWETTLIKSRLFGERVKSSHSFSSRLSSNLKILSKLKLEFKLGLHNAQANSYIFTFFLAFLYLRQYDQI